MVRYIVVGDVHGCYDELIALLIKVDFDDKRDCIIFLGDYTDRGPKAYEVYRFLRGLKLEMGTRCILLFGNHEELIMDYYDTFDPNWKRNGGKTTQKSFKQHNLSLRRYTDFIDKYTNSYYQGKTFQACHAGLENKPLSEQELEVLIWDRSAVKQGFYKGPLTIVGHTPLNNPVWVGPINDEPEYIIYKEGIKYDIPKYGLIAIDTGCAMGGKLTTVVFEHNKMEFFCQENMTGESYMY